VAILSASGQRPDLVADFASYGTAHGWSAELSGLTPEPHTVCAYAINTGPGAGNTTLGCAAI
jgi:hypothetical protein